MFVPVLTCAVERNPVEYVIDVTGIVLVAKDGTVAGVGSTTATVPWPYCRRPLLN